MSTTDDDGGGGRPIAQARARETSDSERPTKPIRPRIARASGTIPVASRPFAFLPEVLESAVREARESMERTARIELSLGPSAVASPREEEVRRLLVALLLEVAASIPTTPDTPSVAVASYTDAEAAIIEIAVRLGRSDDAVRAQHRRTFLDLDRGPGVWAPVVEMLGGHLQLFAERDCCARLYLPLAATS